MELVKGVDVVVLQQLLLVVKHSQYVLVLRDLNDLNQVQPEMLMSVVEVVREDHSSLNYLHYLRKSVEKDKQLVRMIFSLVVVHWKE